MPLFSPSVNAGRFLPWIYTRLCVTGKYFAPSHSRSAKGRHWAETPLYAPTETAHFSLLSSLPTSSSCFKPAPLPIFCFSPSCLASWKGPIASHTFPPSFLFLFFAVYVHSLGELELLDFQPHSVTVTVLKTFCIWLSIRSTIDPTTFQTLSNRPFPCLVCFVFWQKRPL